jgi:GNAT superfamily N-acetyltransferase
MSDLLTVRPVNGWWERRTSLHLPWSIYKGNPNWVAPTLMVEKPLMGFGKHAFYEAARAYNLLAYRGRKAVGRVTAIVNPVHNQKYKDRVGFFGFFECTDDEEAAKALFDAGGAWLREQGMTSVRGPANPSLNYTCGMLLDAYDTPPVIQMTYNPPYYPRLMEACGFIKAHDMYAYEMKPEVLLVISRKYRPAVLQYLQSSNIAIRQFEPKNFEHEMMTYLDIYNQSLEGTWGFTPISVAEARQIASELKFLIDPEFTVMVEIDGKAVGGTLALLDYNPILAKLNGRVFPFGYRLWTQRKSINTARAMALTTVPGYQTSGLGVVMLDDLMNPSERRGITRWEFSWILESNKKTRGSLEKAGVPISKSYRMYEKGL